jgi:hypothetical protein
VPYLVTALVNRCALDLIQAIFARHRQSLGWTPTWSQTQAIAKTMNWWERVLLTKIDSKSAIEDDVDEFLSLFQSKRVSSE